MSRGNLLFMARVYDKCRRTDDCWDTVVQLTKLKGDMNSEQKQIFAASYKAYCSDRKMNMRDCN